jgi:hypothetical protein
MYTQQSCSVEAGVVISHHWFLSLYFRTRAVWLTDSAPREISGKLHFSRVRKLAYFADWKLSTLEICLWVLWNYVIQVQSLWQLYGCHCPLSEIHLINTTFKERTRNAAIFLLLPEIKYVLIYVCCILWRMNTRGVMIHYFRINFVSQRSNDLIPDRARSK